MYNHDKKKSLLGNSLTRARADKYGRIYHWSYQQQKLSAQTWSLRTRAQLPCYNRNYHGQ
jgi:hypothetical protein